MHASWRPACCRGAGPPTAPQSGHPLAHQSRPPPPLLPPGPPGHQQHSTLQTPARQRRPPPAAAHATRRAAAPVPRRRQRRGRRAGCWRAGRWGRQQCKPGIVAAPPRPAALKRTGGGRQMGWCGRCRGQRSCGGWAGGGEAKRGVKSTANVFCEVMFEGPRGTVAATMRALRTAATKGRVQAPLPVLPCCCQRCILQGVLRAGSPHRAQHEQRRAPQLVQHHPAKAGGRRCCQQCEASQGRALREGILPLCRRCCTLRCTRPSLCLLLKQAYILGRHAPPAVQSMSNQE